MVPTSSRSEFDSTGKLIEPGKLSSANSNGERTSITSSYSVRCISFDGMDLICRIKGLTYYTWFAMLITISEYQCKN